MSGLWKNDVPMAPATSGLRGDGRWKFDGAGSNSKRPSGGYLLAVTIGLAVGLSCAWTMWTVGNVIGNRIRALPDAVHEKYFRLLYLGATFWILLTGVFGNVASFLILRLA